jgi:hypothetical protein
MTATTMKPLTLLGSHPDEEPEGKQEEVLVLTSDWR